MEVIQVQSRLLQPDFTVYRVTCVLNVLHGPNEMIQMQLLYSNCVPILTYASAVKDFPAREMTKCNTALNDAIRRIFTFHRWESIRTLRESLGFKSLTELFAISKNKFESLLQQHQNSILRSLHLLNSRLDE